MLSRAVTESAIDLRQFTRDARIAFENARQSQVAHDDACLRTGDVLAGIASTTGPAGRLLADKGISFKVAVYNSGEVKDDSFHRVREPLTEQIDNPHEHGISDFMFYGVFKGAEALAENLGDDLIGTEHLLCAALRDYYGEASKFLQTFKFDIEPIRSEAKALLVKSSQT